MVGVGGQLGLGAQGGGGLESGDGWAIVRGCAGFVGKLLKLDMVGDSQP
jgi:hypothetical protein